MKSQEPKILLAEFQDSLLQTLYSQDDPNALKQEIVKLSTNDEAFHKLAGYESDMLELASYLVRRWGLKSKIQGNE